MADHPDDIPPGQSEVCDFCERPAAEHPPRWYYPLGPATFILGGLELPAPPLGDGWVTCDQCHDLVERGDLAGLAKHIGYGPGSIGWDDSTGLPYTIIQFRDRRQGDAKAYNQQ